MRLLNRDAAWEARRKSLHSLRVRRKNEIQALLAAAPFQYPAIGVRPGELSLIASVLSDPNSAAEVTCGPIGPSLPIMN